MEEVAAYIRGEAESLWSALNERKLLGRTITVKLRTGDFKTATRRLTLEAPPASAEELARVGTELLSKFAFGEAARYRLAGLGVSNFLDEEEEQEEEQPALFGGTATET
jgi:DNA polymerase-4